MTRTPRGAKSRAIVLAVLFGAASPRVHAQDSWDAIYLAGSKIGWVHTWVEKEHHAGKDYLRVQIDCQQRLKRNTDISLRSSGTTRSKRSTARL